jgi:hypothetical protein
MKDCDARNCIANDYTFVYVSSRLAKSFVRFAFVIFPGCPLEDFVFADCSPVTRTHSKYLATHAYTSSPVPDLLAGRYSLLSGTVKQDLRSKMIKTESLKMCDLQASMTPSD